MRGNSLMNVYDFDGTIYDGDSSVDFYFFSLKQDKRVLKALPLQVVGMIKFLFSLIDKTEFKESFFSFLNYLDNIDKVLYLFTEQKRYKIKSWYLEQKREDDVIISASPDFIVERICNTCDINNVIASKVNNKTGKFLSPNCWGIQKVHRFEQEYSLELIDAFYSDSKSDEPIAQHAKSSYYIKGDKILPWNQAQ